MVIDTGEFQRYVASVLPPRFTGIKSAKFLRHHSRFCAKIETQSTDCHRTRALAAPLRRVGRRGRPSVNGATEMLAGADRSDSRATSAQANEGPSPSIRARLRALDQSLTMTSELGMRERSDQDTGISALVRATFLLVPPAGFEPAPPAPEAGALSPELRGQSRDGSFLIRHRAVSLDGAFKLSPSMAHKGGLSRA